MDELTIYIPNPRVNLRSAALPSAGMGESILIHNSVLRQTCT